MELLWWKHCSRLAKCNCNGGSGPYKIHPNFSRVLTVSTQECLMEATCISNTSHYARYVYVYVFKWNFISSTIYLMLCFPNCTSYHPQIIQHRQENSYQREVQGVPQTEWGLQTQEPLDRVSVVGMVGRKELAHTRGQREMCLWGKEVLAQFD